MQQKRVAKGTVVAKDKMEINEQRTGQRKATDA